MTKLDAPQHRNKLEQVSYLTGLIAIINYLDDTGQEHHAEKVMIAEEWDKAFGELCVTIKEEDEEHDARTS